MGMRGQFDPVVWAEGVVLGQQHFQCWDNYHRALINLCHRMVAPYCWGVIKLEVDECALLNRQFKLRRCLALLKTGLVVNHYSGGDIALYCDLSELGTGERSELFLEVPNSGYVAKIAGYPSSDQAPTWSVDYQKVEDLYDCRREREVMFGRLCPRLRRDIGGRGDSQMLKIAEVENVNGQLNVVDSYVPAITTISSSSFLIEMVNFIRELIIHRLSVLNSERQPRNMRELLLINILAEVSVKLHHLAAHLELHPRELFLALAGLISKLCALSSKLTLTHLPEYDHEQLGTVFVTLRTLLLRVIDEVMPNRMSEIKLSRRSRSLYVANDLNDGMLVNNDWLLAVNITDIALLDELLRQIKIAAPTAIDALTISASSGVQAIKVAHLPEGLFPRVGYSYVHILKQGDFWSQIRREKSLALFVPENVADIKIKLISLCGDGDE